MKKLFAIIAGAAVLIGLLFAVGSTPAMAAASGPSGWFVGVDAVYDGVTFSRTGKAFGLKSGAMYGGDLYAGYQLFQGVSLEAGLGGACGITGISTFNTSICSQNIFVESTIRVPLYTWLDLDVVPAVEYSAAHINLGELGTGHDYSWGYRIGAGPEVTLGEDVGWRTLVSYQQQGFHFTNGDVSLITGLTWHL